MDSLEHSDERRQGTANLPVPAGAAPGQQALELSRRRAKVAAALTRAITAEIRLLGMPDAQFKIELDSTDDPDGVEVEVGRRVRLFATGIEQAEFRLAVNYGTQPAPLRQVASGGEISRVMLAIKTVLARSARIPTMIFDEIDAGIGGRIGEVVARKLAALALHHQVLCITHMPGIAARADYNLFVDKERAGKGTVVRISALDGKEKVGEIVRLLGSSIDSKTAVRMAREMLELAGQERRERQ
ncbi:hypothetical protein HS125_08065 [bacterium]|nr:hypothetical protein [bacterium]